MRHDRKQRLRVLHSAALLSPPSGILAQMDIEQEAAKPLGIDWVVRMYCPKNSSNKARVLHYDDDIDAQKLTSNWVKLFAWLKLRRNYHRWLLRQQDRFDIFLLRYYVHDPFQLDFVRRCKKPVYFVHHTLEVPELALPGGIKGFVRSTLEDLLGPPTISRAAGLIGVTKEIVEYELARARCPEKSNYVYPNGILFKDLMLEDKRGTDVPELLFVANFAPWHGLDLLLKSVANNQENFILHLVGKVPDDLMDLTHDRRIKVYGHLAKNEIMELSYRCWVGLASFALFRKKMKQACPLKVREYLMIGLPVYGDADDVFPEDFLFYRKGPASISQIIKFAFEVREISKVRISRLSENYVDKGMLLKGLQEHLVGLEG